MTYCQIRRLIRLHEKAERHSNNYKKLSMGQGAKSKALEQLRKSERLYSQVTGIIRNVGSAQA